MSGRICLYMALAYLLGSFPSAYLIGRVAKGVDVRQVGNGNVGARNAFLSIGRWAGIAVGVVDIAKGSIAVLVAKRAGLDELWVLAIGGMAVLGHDFMLFLGFRGGQGMATSIGVLLVVLPRLTLIGLCVAAVVMFLLKRSFDLSMAVGLGAVPLLAWITGEPLQRALYPVALLPVIGVRKLVQILSARDVRAAKDNGFRD